MRYDIYEINLYINANIKIAKKKLFSDKYKMKTLKNSRWELNQVYKVLVLRSDMVEEYIHNLNNKDFRGYMSFEVQFYLFNENNKYSVYNDSLAEIIEKKIKYRKLDFNSKTIEYWKDVLGASDLVKIITQEKVEVEKILSINNN